MRRAAVKSPCPVAFVGITYCAYIYETGGVGSSEVLLSPDVVDCSQPTRIMARLQVRKDGHRADRLVFVQRVVVTIPRPCRLVNSGAHDQGVRVSFLDERSVNSIPSISYVSVECLNIQLTTTPEGITENIIQFTEVVGNVYRVHLIKPMPGRLYHNLRCSVHRQIRYCRSLSRYPKECH
jgi:hypothetical protein